MVKKTNKNYCNGCIYSRWRAGVDSSLVDRIGVEAHPKPEHTCLKLNIKRERNNFRIDSMPECVAKRFADYRGAM